MVIYPKRRLSLLNLFFRNSFNISTITRIEVLGWHRISKEERVRVEKFLNNAKVFYINKIIEKKSIEIKQKIKIPTPDTIIAAIALENDFVVVTRNEADFKKIGEIEIYNPFD